MVLPALFFNAHLSQPRQRLLSGLFHLLLCKLCLLMKKPGLFAAVGDQHQIAVQYLKADVRSHLKPCLRQPLSGEADLLRA